MLSLKKLLRMFRLVVTVSAHRLGWPTTGIYETNTNETPAYRRIRPHRPRSGPLRSPHPTDPQKLGAQDKLTRQLLRGSADRRSPIVPVLGPIRPLLKKHLVIAVAS